VQRNAISIPVLVGLRSWLGDFCRDLLQEAASPQGSPFRHNVHPTSLSVRAMDCPQNNVPPVHRKYESSLSSRPGTSVGRVFTGHLVTGCIRDLFSADASMVPPPDGSPYQKSTSLQNFSSEEYVKILRAEAEERDPPRLRLALGEPMSRECRSCNYHIEP